MTASTRRTVLVGVGTVGVSTAVTGCGGDEGAAPERTPDGGAPGSSAGADDTDDPIATVSDLPVGGGVVLRDRKLVLTRPSDGEIKAFSAVCTHRGCTVAEVADGTINCSCHGSTFDAGSGDVRKGPATRRLDTVDITVKGDEVFLT